MAPPQLAQNGPIPGLRILAAGPPPGERATECRKDRHEPGLPVLQDAALVSRSSARAAALLLAHGKLRTPNGKSSHALIRGPSRYEIVGVVDPECAGQDAGELLDGIERGIPVFDSLASALEQAEPKPTVCVLGVATPGGVLPDELRGALGRAADAGMTLVNGLHQLLGDLPDLVERAKNGGGEIIDLRRPRPTRELRFWGGEILRCETPRIAVLGTDCAVGKRTTCALIHQACHAGGMQSEMIFTGQTGWLLGLDYGFILDATPNDFVSGELERSILDCVRDLAPDLVLIEGQSALRNPTGPCGSELLLSAAASGVVLQHAPARVHYIDTDAMGCRIPPIEEEVALIRCYGVEVLAVTLNSQGLSRDAAISTRKTMEQRLGLPVVLPLEEGVSRVVAAIRGSIAGGGES